MIKLGQYIRIKIFTVILFVILILTNQWQLLFVTYITIFFHELAHLFAASCIGLRCDNITFEPFGVNLKLKNKIVADINDEVILYLSGPLFNAVCALVSFAFKGDSYVLEYFYTCNIVLFIINLLPILPLDGGMVLKKILTYFFGYRKAHICLTITSVIFISFLSVIEIYSAVNAGINYSVIIMIVFLSANIFTQKEKYDVDLLDELMFFKNKKTDRADVFVLYDGEDIRKIAKKFLKSRYGVVIKLDNDGKIDKILSENEIIRELTE